MGDFPEAVPPKPERITSIDQLRGYAIFGMILVNYLGKFTAMPEGLKHHRDLADWPLFGFDFMGDKGFNFGFTFADSIAPLFMFVVGMGFRISFQNHVAKVGLAGARIAAVKRFSLLVLIGYVLYGYEFRWIWDALVDIGFAGLLALPFILLSTRARIATAVGYIVVYQFLFMSPWFWDVFRNCLNALPTSEAYPLLGEWTRWTNMSDFSTYGDWIMRKSIDGGPLGPLSWVFCLLMGTVAYDLMAKRDPKTIVTGCLAWGIGLFIAGWALRLSWGEVKGDWFFTQYGMTAPYALASTGTSFIMLLVFYVLSDIGKCKVPGLSVLGMNALTIYCVQQVILETGGRWMPKDSSVTMALLGFAVMITLCYGVARKLYNDNIIIKL